MGSQISSVTPQGCVSPDWHVKTPFCGVVSYSILLKYVRCSVAYDDWICNYLCASWPTTDPVSVNSDCLIKKEVLVLVGCCTVFLSFTAAGKHFGDIS